MRTYHAKETSRMQELDGLTLADFWQRAGALALDVALLGFVLLIAGFLFAVAKWTIETGADSKQPITYHFNPEQEWARIAFETAVSVLYFGLSIYFWNGRTPGKRLFGVRVVSLVHERMTLWHSIERALGYGAAALELGFGFAQFFIHPRRTAEDRLAETVVVKESAYRELLARHDATKVAGDNPDPGRPLHPAEGAVAK
jgi:uncharacterized RDD family membrane protein YckC